MAMMIDSHLARALRVSPNGSQTKSKAPGRVGPSFGSGEVTDFPLFAIRGVGAYLRDDRGREYLDCFGANATVPLGYAYAPVVLAVTDALNRGSLLSLPHVLEAEVSEQFLRVCAPWAEQVRWVKTGTEALMAAVRVARAVTRRAKIVALASSYHGWADWTDARHVASGWNGVPLEARHGIVLIRVGDSRAALTDAAALVIEPERWTSMDPIWLMDIVKAAREAGAVVIFDELVYGLRWAKGGGSEYYGVTPDLAAFGKALGNGVPVACFCGLAEIMQVAGQYISGTYFGDTLGLAAADAVLKEYDTRDVIGELWDNGAAMWQAFEGALSAEATAAGVRLGGRPVHWRLDASDLVLDETLIRCAAAGVLVHRASNNASAAMTRDEASHAGRVLAEAASEAVSAVPQ